MKQPLFIGLFVLLGAIGIGWYVQSKPPQTSRPEPLPTVDEQPAVVDSRAAFAIFTNGIFRVFTAAMYHRRSGDVYIEETNPNIIKIKKAGVTWDDFFKTLPFTLTHECLTTGTKETFCTNANKTLRFYLNGVLKTTVLDGVIHHSDKLLVSYGNEEEPIISQQLKKIPHPTL